MDYSKIRKKAKELRFTFERMAEVSGLTTAGLREALKNGTLRIDHLEKISKEIGIPMIYWFQEDDLIMHEKDSSNKMQSSTEIKNLNKIIEELRDDKKRMKDQIDELKADKIKTRSDFDLILTKHGISKVGTYE
ncbi:MAG: hypothetical protein ACOYM0_01250 [Bacteroidales bacterium]